MRLIVSYLAGILVLSGCSAIHIYEGDRRADNETVLVKANMPFTLFSRGTWTKIVRIDGEIPKTYSMEHEFRLMPGDHTVNVYCLYWCPMYCSLMGVCKHQSFPVKFTVNLEKGRQYIFKATTNSESTCELDCASCTIQLEDLETGEVIQKGTIKYYNNHTNC